MIVVLDTSAAVELVLQRRGAAAISEVLAKAERVIAPMLYVSETTNVFWKYYRFSDMPLERCEAAIERAIALPDDYVADKELYREAFALACLAKVPAYDAYFLILSRRNNAFLLTTDVSLKKTAQKHTIRVV